MVAKLVRSMVAMSVRSQVAMLSVLGFSSALGSVLPVSREVGAPKRPHPSSQRCFWQSFLEVGVPQRPRPRPQRCSSLSPLGVGGPERPHPKSQCYLWPSARSEVSAASLPRLADAMLAETFSVVVPKLAGTFSVVLTLAGTS